MPNQIYKDMRNHNLVRIVRQLNNDTYEVRTVFSGKRYVVEKSNLRPVDFYSKTSEKDVA